MGTATDLVLALCGGVVVLLIIWFEIKSRRNEASNAKLAGIEALPKECQTNLKSESEKKAA